ncbi:MAG: M20/M25/M40 family metallo-hydrolase [Promethearchaeota archaeon]
MEKNTSESTIEKLIKESNERYIQEELVPFLSIPSNTLNKEGINQAKEYILSYISGFCENIEIFEGEYNPLIVARIEGESREQLLIYMMYDTQPISNASKWISDPFGASLKKLPPPLEELGNCLIARGAFNSKTPLLNFLNVVKTLKKHEALGISLLLLFDGEEEIGSPSLIKFLKSNKRIFNDVIGAYYPSAKQGVSGEAVLKLGYKGILSMSLKTTSLNSEPHSSFSRLIPNPVLDLIGIINRIYSNNSFHIKSLATPYKMSMEESLILDDLLKTIDLENIKKKAGIKAMTSKNGHRALLDYLFNSTFNISTIKAGYLEKGIKNHVPNEATCNIDIRFAHDISIDEIFGEIKEIVDNMSSSLQSEVSLVKNMGYEGSRVGKNSNLVKSLVSSFQKLHVNTEIWPISPAAAPLSQIKRLLGIEFIVGGLGIGGFAHSPNEFIQVESIVNSRLCNYYFLKKYYESIDQNLSNS